MTLELVASHSVSGSLRVPGDKSISHRAILLSAMASGESTIEGLSHGADVRGTLHIMLRLGAKVVSGSRVSVVGPAEGLRQSSEALDCGNSGTTARLLMGLLAGIPGTHHLDGDASLRRRPMARVLEPLQHMGLQHLYLGDEGCLPVALTSSGRTKAMDYHSPVASAQIKGAILFAGLSGDGPTSVSESPASRTNTEDMFAEAGIRVERRDTENEHHVTMWPGRPLARAWRVPGDPSQAAFFAVLAAITGGRISFEDLYLGAERIGFLHVLARMGAVVSMSEHEVVVTGGDLVGTSIDASEIPSVDEVPALAVACAAANGPSVFTRVGELRHKESDRFASTIALLTAMGVRAWGEGDDLHVEGVGSARKFEPFRFGSALDHRMVMAAAIAGVGGSGVQISTPDAVGSSYPNFFEHLESVTQ